MSNGPCQSEWRVHTFQTTLGFGYEVWYEEELMHRESWRLYDTEITAYHAGISFIDGFKHRAEIGWAGAAHYLLSHSTSFLHATISLNDGNMVLQQVPGEWFTTFLVRAAWQLSKLVGDLDEIVFWQTEYAKCSDGTKGLDHRAERRLFDE